MRFASAAPLLLALVAAVSAVPGVARAQTTTSGPSVTGILGTVLRLEQDGSSADDKDKHPHPNGVLVNAINFEDCIADLKYRFDLGISNVDTSYNLDVWAGTQDCTQIANRQAATAVCWPVTNPTPATTNPVTVEVNMEDIVSQVTLTSHTVSYARANANVCQLQTATGAQNVSLYFFFEQSGNAVGTGQPYPVKVDTRAGDVQGNITVGQGDTLLVVNIPSTTDTDTQEWNVYCDPPPGGEPDGSNVTVAVDAATNGGQCTNPNPTTPSDASTADGSSDSGASLDATASASDASSAILDDAGGNYCGTVLSDSGIPSPGGCSSSNVLTPGTGGTPTIIGYDEAGAPIYGDGGTTTVTTEAGTTFSAGGTMKLIPSQYLCGQGSATSTQILVKQLQDGKFYNVAVAAVDGVGNVGPLSNVACGEPIPVTDFWDRYRQANGSAGGFCSVPRGVGAPPVVIPASGSGVADFSLPAGTSGLATLMFGSMIALVRRRRRS